MPSALHEAIVEMLRAKPDLVLVLLGSTQRSLLTTMTANVVGEALTALLPDYRPDCVVEVRDASGRPVRIIVAEAQLHRDDEKLFALPVYQALVRARHRLPCEIVVVTPERRVAWLKRPIALGGGSVCRATVIGPDEILRLSPLAPPEIGFLQALASGDRNPVLLVAVLDRLRDLPERRAALYCDLILSSLPDATRRVLEDLMLKNYEYQSDFARRYVAEGLVLSLRKVFAVRGIVLTEEQSARLEACTDRTVLEAWLERAVVARDAAEVFEPV